MTPELQFFLTRVYGPHRLDKPLSADEAVDFANALIDAFMDGPAKKPLECLPDPQCRCCVCRGIHCFMWHPGHNHADGSVEGPLIKH